jgi:hypothetical protein
MPLCHVMSVAVNWSLNQGSPECQYRVCTNPAKPQLWPLPGYEVYVTQGPKFGVIMTAWYVITAFRDATA